MMCGEKIKILLVEDDVDFGNVLKQYIEFSEFEVTIGRNAREGMELFRKKDFDLCVLDVMLPGLDGFSLAKEIKKVNKDIPFIFLTARTDKVDRMFGLRLGADDYICKPFEADELLLRIKNILQRTKRIKSHVISIGTYEFNPENYMLTRKGKQKHLTEKEARLLGLLFENKNKVIKRSKILEELWGKDDYFFGRSMDVFISRLRKYLHEDDSVSVENIRGIGFVLKIQESKKK
jgi:DNA-binding response OmpR family regulator